PSGAKLLVPHHPEGAKDISFHDLNGDGENEAIIVYEETIQNQRELWAALLKEENGQWKIIWKTKGLGYEIDYIGFADITGDGKSEVLLGWTLGASAGNGLDIYK